MQSILTFGFLFVVGVLLGLVPVIGWGLACLVGGALGNLVDRFRYGYVVDFIDFHVWPVFNLADTCVVIGAGLLMIHGLTAAPTCKPPEAPAEQASENPPKDNT